MRWDDAIDEYMRDQQQAARINSNETVRAYRRVLALHAQDTPAGPLAASREHSCLRSFYDYLSTEGLRPDNPARQVRRAKVRKPNIYRLTRQEVAALIAACETVREQRVILLGVCAGARAMELTFLQGRHFARPGFVWFSADIAKGASERWVPVVGELTAVAEDIRATTQPDHYAINAQCGGGPVPLLQRNPTYRVSYESLRRIVVEVGRRAGIAAHVHPHLLRHAYGDHVARHAGLRVAQALMGHAKVETTAEVYTGRPSLDELAASVRGLRYGESQAERLERFGRQMQSATSTTGAASRVTRYHT
jgi:integrase/recombinase XerC